MEFTAELSDLKNGIALAGKAALKRSTIPALTHMFIEWDKDGVYITSTDLVVTVRTRVNAQVKSDGKVALPAIRFSDYIGALSDGKVKWKRLPNMSVTLNTNGGQGNIKGIAPEEYPEVKVISDADILGGNYITINPSELALAIKETIGATTIDEGRPYLGGIFFDYDKGNLALAAADGFRVSVARLTAVGKLEKFVAVVPADGLRRLASVLDKDPVLMFYEPARVVFKSGDTQVAVQLIQEDFPNYRVLMSQPTTMNSDVDVAKFKAAVRACSVFARDMNNVVKFHFEKDGKLELSSESDSGYNNSEIDAATSEDLTIAFSSGYVLDICDSMPSKRMRFEGVNPDRPGAFRPLAEDGSVDNSFISVVMPMYLKKEEEKAAKVAEEIADEEVIVI